MLKEIQDDKTVAEKWFKKSPILIIFFSLLIGTLFGIWLTTMSSVSKFFNKQLPQLSSDAKNPTVAEINLPILVDFQKTKKAWDLKDFIPQTDGFYCPRERKNYDYYYAWYNQEIPLISSNLFKVIIRPYNLTYENESGEVVIKVGEKTKKEYTEFYLPTRFKESVQYKQRSNGIMQFYPQAGELLTSIKENTPIEILSRITVANDNWVGTKNLVTYIPKSSGPNSNRITNPFTYSNFTVEETRPLSEMVKVGLGVNKNSCFKIEGYDINLSNEEVQAILDQY